MKNQQSKQNSNRIYFQQITERELKGRSHGQNRASPTCVRNTKIKEHTRMQMSSLKKWSSNEYKKEKTGAASNCARRALDCCNLLHTHTVHTKSLTLLSVPNYAWMERSHCKRQHFFSQAGVGSIILLEAHKDESRTPAGFQLELQIAQLTGKYEGPSKQVPKTHHQWGKHLPVWQAFKAGIFKLLCWIRIIH